MSTTYLPLLPTTKVRHKHQFDSEDLRQPLQNTAPAFPSASSMMRRMVRAAAALRAATEAGIDLADRARPLRVDGGADILISKHIARTDDRGAIEPAIRQSCRRQRQRHRCRFSKVGV